jgi:hypothetical protein
VYVWWAQKIPFIGRLKTGFVALTAVILTIGSVMTFVSLLYSPGTKYLELDEVGERQ